MRRERDSLGEFDVADDAMYGIHTARSLANFRIGGGPVPMEIIRALVRIKEACAVANRDLDELPADKAEAICGACRAVLEGGLDDAFPIDIFQAGSGTSTNMNVNEVLANLAAERLGGRRGRRDLLHPNDDVNRGQSTNNVFPSALRVAVFERDSPVRGGLDALHAALERKGDEFGSILKSGRTHLQDAVPMTLGQAFHAWAAAVAKARDRLGTAADPLLELGLGGNAIGTGLNTPAPFRTRAVSALHEITGIPFRTAENGIERTQFLTDLAAYSAALRLAATDVNKVCNDLRLLASGPNTGLGELVLPAVEPGSSIMPGKINPSLCEAANMACLQIAGLDHAVQAAAAAGQLELNTHMPLAGANLIRAGHLLERTCRMLAEGCVAGIRARTDVCAQHFERSAGLGTVLNPLLGYDRVAELVKESLRTGKSLRELVLEHNEIDAEAFDHLLRASTGPRA